LYSPGIENPHSQCETWTSQTTSNKRKTVEYQQGKKAKRILLSGFSSRGFTIKRCLKNLQHIKITIFTSPLSTVFPFVNER
jgi:hypothetical protein